MLLLTHYLVEKEELMNKDIFCLIDTIHLIYPIDISRKILEDNDFQELGHSDRPP